MQQVCGISSPAAAALRSIHTPSNICGFTAPNTVGSVSPTHLSDLRLPSRLHHDLGRPFASSPLTGVGKGAGAGVSAAEVVSFVEPTPPLPSVSLLWLMSFPSGWPPASIKKESLSIPLAFTSTRLFLQNTHENTQLWLDCSLSYFRQIPDCVLPFKASPPFLFGNHDTDLG